MKNNLKLFSKHKVLRIRNLFFYTFILITSTYELQAQPWIQLGDDIIGEAAGDRSGYALSLNSEGSTLAIGARNNVTAQGMMDGQVRVYKWEADMWVQKGEDIDGEAGDNTFGFSVDMDSIGNTFVATAESSNFGAGTTRVFQWVGDVVWVQKGQDIPADGSYTHHGWDVAISSNGNSVVISSPNSGFSGQPGAVEVYEWSGSVWLPKGDDIIGEEGYGEFGTSVAMSSNGNTIAVGAETNSGNGDSRGSTRVYFWNGTDWVQKGGDIDGDIDDGRFGYDISLSSDGNTLAVAAYASGYVYVFEWNGANWIQKGINLNIGYPTSVSLDSDASTLAIGSETSNGKVQVFKWINNNWEEQGEAIEGAALWDRFGWATSISSDGNILAVGAPDNDGNGSNSGHARVFSSNCMPTSSTASIEACDSYTWIDGNTYTNSNNSATYTTTNVNGCDSVITLNLTIFNTTSSMDIISSCDSYTWIDGNTYMSSNNSATYTVPSSSGCDSVITLDLTILNTTSSTDIISSCGSYTWIDGNTYVSSNNSATYTIPNANGCDSVITLDLTIFNTTSSTDIISSCDAYTWIDGNTYTSSNNSATYTVPNANGCDSIITLDLTINTVNASISYNPPILSANVSGASYQWLDCNNDYSIISGATSQNYTPSSSGNYAVAITQNNCADTSECVNTVLVNSQINHNENNLFIIYPNPLRDKAMLNIGSIGTLSVRIYNFHNQLVKEYININTNYININGMDMSPGVYQYVIFNKAEVIYRGKFIVNK